jgi:hypothetical protein
MGERPSQRRVELGARRGHLGQTEAPVGMVVGADVPAPPAIGDDRAAADDGLEHRQAHRRVDEGVAGRQPIAHHIGEAQRPQAALAGEARGQARAHRLHAPAQAHDGGSVDAQRRLGRSLEVAHRPPATRDDDDRPVGREVERAARVAAIARDEEVRGPHAVGPDDAAGRRDGPHLLDRLAVDDEVQVDARCAQ